MGARERVEAAEPLSEKPRPPPASITTTNAQQSIDAAMIKLLSPLAYRVLPWKNGGGSTTEIAVDPEGATWEVFNWRVAIADIGGSGSFSSFPGIDRSILLLDA